MSLPDDILVDRLRNKDKGAFELVFNEYYGLMKTYAFRFVDESDEAEEIAQQVFVKFWEKCHLLKSDSSIKSYLYRSVHNTCLNYIKHEKVKDAYREYVIGFMENSQPEQTAESDPEMLHKRIMDEIDNLPPRCAEIFRLSRFDGLKYKEIAEYLEISIKTVEVQMGKALKLLRENLKDLNT